MMFSEQDYNLPELWFTGQQWQDGTATMVYQRLYKVRKKELIQNPPPRLRNKRFIKWFAYSLENS